LATAVVSCRGKLTCKYSRHRFKQKLSVTIGEHAEVTYFSIGDFSTALTTFESALDFQKTVGDPIRIRIARWTVARSLRALKRYDEAFAIQNDLIQYPEQGYVSEKLGELHLVLSII
jgi:tetratricopeptide (TPR) repeat protein